MNKKQNEELLSELFKIVKSGIQSINILIIKTSNDDQLKDISMLLSDLELFEKEIVMLANAVDLSLKDNNVFQKIETWVSNEFRTLTNQATQNVAVVLVEGFNTSIIDILKAKAESTHANIETVELGERIEAFFRVGQDKLRQYIEISPNNENQKLQKAKMRNGSKSTKQNRAQKSLREKAKPRLKTL